LVQTWLAGQSSGLRRKALVWLPPQYDDPAAAGTKFPVVLLLHGDPGEPRGFVYGMHVPTVADELVRAGRMRPVVIVMPTVWAGWHGQQCLDAAHGPPDETYLTKDVPRAIQRAFRVSATGPGWAIAGLSEGGFCAVDLALRHPGEFAGAASLDGYFAPDVSRGLRQRLFGRNNGAQLAATPLAVVRDWPAPHAPALWLMAGDQDRGDLGQLRAFAAAAAHVSSERTVIVHRGRHTTPSWRAALPDLLVWSGELLTKGTPPTGPLTLTVDGSVETPSP
jgi:S-formylglutathione hydrolase FrmB